MREKKEKEKIYTATQSNLLCEHTTHHQKKKDMLLSTPWREQNFGHHTVLTRHLNDAEAMTS
jgi:hypothetical protein